MEGGRRPVVVRPLVVLLLETRAVLAHDRDDPKDELADLHHDSAKAIRARDVRVGGQRSKIVDQQEGTNKLDVGSRICAWMASPPMTNMNSDEQQQQWCWFETCS